MKKLLKIAAIVLGALSLLGALAAILSKAARSRDDDLCWPNNAEFKKCNDEAWAAFN